MRSGDADAMAVLTWLVHSLMTGKISSDVPAKYDSSMSNEMPDSSMYSALNFIVGAPLWRAMVTVSSSCCSR